MMNCTSSGMKDRWVSIGIRDCSTGRTTPRAPRNATASRTCIPSCSRSNSQPLKNTRLAQWDFMCLLDSTRSLLQLRCMTQITRSITTTAKRRTFCPERYGRSFDLPNIIRTLERRRCEFARGMSGLINYVTMETRDGERYAAFFDLRRFRKLGPTAVHLTVESAYVLDRHKPAPGKGRIHFHTLLGHVIRGKPSRRPP